MESSALLELAAILFLILLNGFFAGAEIAIITARRGRLESKAEAGQKGAQIALHLAADPNRFLATVQVGITLVGTFAAVFGGARLVQSLAELIGRSELPGLAANRNAIALAVVTGGIAFFSLILGELVPKRFALRNAEGLATFVAFPMAFIGKLARPIVAFLGMTTQLVLRLFGMRDVKGPTVSLEDIQHLIETGTQEGLVQPAAERMALEALQLGDRTVRDILRPRVDIDALDIDTPPEEVLGLVATAGYSRLPVYEESLDHVLGFVYIKDLVRRLHQHQPLNLRELLRPALFIPETLTISRLLERFREEGTQLAVVLDEYGGTEGIVTVEDVVEELVGQIHDEHRRDETQMIVQRDDRSWLVDGGLTLRDLCEHLGDDLHAGEKPEDVSTVSGLVLSELERMPKIGDVVTWGNISLEVVDMDGPRIDRLLITRQSTTAPTSPEG